jgi:glucose/arabinose dehydrogenase
MRSRFAGYLYASLFALLLLGLLSWSACGGSSHSTSSSSNSPGVSGGGTSGNSGGGSGSGGSGGSTSVPVTTETVASGLTVPWSLQFAPDGRLFFTEQPGRLRVIVNGQLQAQPVFDVTATTAGGEAGTTGMALDRILRAITSSISSGVTRELQPSAIFSASSRTTAQPPTIRLCFRTRKLRPITPAAASRLA